jgi:tetratricopeptide (TPR) repeat protein
MNETKYYKASRKHKNIKILGITALALLMLVSIAGVARFANSKDWNKEGVDLNSLGKYDEAIEAFDKAIEIDPHSSLAWYNKGNALYSLNKLDGAVKAYDKSIEINPKYPMAWNNKGVVLDNLNKHEEAIKAFDKAIEIDPQNSLALYNKRNV